MNQHFTINLATDPMALFPVMGVIRWYRPTREHGEVYGEQLLYTRVLEKLASQLQPMGHQVSSLYLIFHGLS